MRDTRHLQSIFDAARGVGGIVEIRVKQRNSRKVRSGYFDDFERMTKQVEGYDKAKSTEAIWITLNPVRPELLARGANHIDYIESTTKDAEILQRAFLLFDLDPKGHLSGISSTDEEHQAALTVGRELADWLVGLGWPPPLMGDSGNGCHVLSRVDLPNDKDADALGARVYQAVKARFGDRVDVDTKVANPARVVKVLGTWARKGDNLPDRPWRQSAISEEGSLEPVSRETLEKVASLAPAPRPKGKAPAADVEAILDHLRGLGLEISGPKEDDDRAVWDLSPCPWDTDHHTGSFVQRFEDGGILVACHHQSCHGKGLRDVPGWSNGQPDQPHRDSYANRYGFHPPQMRVSQSSRFQTPSAKGIGLDEVLSALVAYFRRFVVFPSDHHPIAVALFVVYSYAQSAFDTAPYLWVASPTKRAGKSLLFELIREVAYHGWLITSPTGPTLFRKIDEHQSTVLIDEVDQVFKGNEEARASILSILNSGYRRGLKVPRMEKQGLNYIVRDFDVFGPKAFSGIYDLPDTLRDRSIPIRIVRKKQQEKVQRFGAKNRRVAVLEMKPTVRTLTVWMEPAPEFGEPVLPEDLNDRQQDIWEPLLAIADLAGSGWPEKARAAAVSLHGLEEEQDPLILLLWTIREVYAETGREFLPSEELVGCLVKNHEGPWGVQWAKAVSRSEYLSPVQGLAKMLRPINIGPKQTRRGSDVLRGYHHKDFEDAFSRYLPERTGAGTVTTVTSPPKPLPEPSESVTVSSTVALTVKLHTVTAPPGLGWMLHTPEALGINPSAPRMPNSDNGFFETWVGRASKAQRQTWQVEALQFLQRFSQPPRPDADEMLAQLRVNMVSWEEVHPVESHEEEVEEL